MKIDVVVDDMDRDLLDRPWFLSNGYARRNKIVDEKKHNVYMHRVIMERVLGRQLSTKELVDHKDGNRLNNSRSNLRICPDRSAHSANRIKRPGLSSRYLGVTKMPFGSPWQASGTKDGKCYYLGRYKSEDDAARAYNKWATEAHGEFASLNEVPDVN